MKNYVVLGLAVLCLCACSQTKYIAHVAKQIPLDRDKPMNTVGHFKVGSPYTIKGRRYFPQESYNLVETGTASWYGPGFHGKQTANGEIFDQTELTAAHRTLQLPSIIRVTNLENGRSVIMRVNDRGPFAHERILDVSERGAVVLGFKRQGTANIRLEVLGPESREVASFAKAGKSTRGYEVAYNQRPQTPTNNRVVNNNVPRASMPISQMQARQPVTKVAMNETVSLRAPVAPAPLQQATTLAARQNAITPAAGTAQQASKLFVQAGSFGDQRNASNYQQQLAKLGPTEMFNVQVNGQNFYRVRIGPFADQNYAQHVLSMLQQSGNQSAKLIQE